MRLIDKISEIERYLSEMSTVQPVNLEHYKNDLKTKAACERYFEKVIEALVDLAFLILKNKSLSIPEDDKTAFDLLAKENIISSALAIRLKEAKGMRNILAHEYGVVDDEIVFEAITKEIKQDAIELLNSVIANHIDK